MLVHWLAATFLPSYRFEEGTFGITPGQGLYTSVTQLRPLEVLMTLASTLGSIPVQENQKRTIKVTITSLGNE